jgi:hypothetical protein
MIKERYGHRFDKGLGKNTFLASLSPKYENEASLTFENTDDTRNFGARMDVYSYKSTVIIVENFIDTEWLSLLGNDANEIREITSDLEKRLGFKLSEHKV